MESNASRESNDRNLAVIAHLSVFFAPLLAPGVLFAAHKRESFVARQAAEALNFHITWFIVQMIAAFGVTAYWIIGFLGLASSVAARSPTGFAAIFGSLFLILPLFALLALVPVIFGIVAALRVSRGEDYRYPLTIRFFR